MPQFRSKKKASGENQAYPLEPGSDIKSGPFPKGSKPLKKNVNEVKLKQSKQPSSKEKEPEVNSSTSGSGSSDVCSEAEKVLESHDND